MLHDSCCEHLRNRLRRNRIRLVSNPGQEHAVKAVKLANGVKIWAITRRTASWVDVFFNEDEARDQLRRTEKLSSFMVSEYRDEA